VRAFNIFAESANQFAPQNIENLFLDLDIKEDFAASSLKNYYKKMITIGVVSYGFKQDDFK
jgi:hypothetical protein